MCGKADSGLKAGGIDADSKPMRPVCMSCYGDVFHIPPTSWQRFTQPELMANDVPVKEAQIVIKNLIKFGNDVHYISGRQEMARSVTMEWLTKHFDFDATKNKLLLRSTDGFSDPTLHVPASVHKERAFKQLIEWQGYTGKESFFFADDDVFALRKYALYGIVLHAPDCWKSMVPPNPTNAEQLFTK